MNRTGRATVDPLAPVRRLPRTAAAVAAAVVLLVVLPTWCFLLPAGDPPVRADAVVVLNGPGPRIQAGEGLVRRGFADVLVVSTETPDICTPTVEVRAEYCFRPRPNSTRGEAEAVGRLARRHRWRTILVVAQNEQVRRARLRVARCLPAGVRVRMVAVRVSAAASVERTVYEMGAYLKAVAWQRSC